MFLLIEILICCAKKCFFSEECSFFLLHVKMSTADFCAGNFKIFSALYNTLRVLFRLNFTLARVVAITFLNFSYSRHKLVSLELLRDSCYVFICLTALLFVENLVKVIRLRCFPDQASCLVKALELARHNLHSDHLVLLLRVRDALVVVASLKCKLLVVTVLLLLDELLHEVTAFHEPCVMKVGLLTIGLLPHSRKVRAYCLLLFDIVAADALVRLAALS